MIILFFLLFIQSPISLAAVEDGISSHLICPCECGMVLSTCDCPTAIKIQNEISSMKESGFSGTQISSALAREYGDGIIALQKKDFSSLWAGGIILSVVLVLLGFFAARKPYPRCILSSEEYERRFDEEYRKFLEMENK